MDLEGKKNLADILGQFGGYLSLLFIFSPIPIFFKGFKTRKIDSLSFLFLLSCVGNALLWTCYGLNINDPNIININLTSLVFNIGYVCCFLWIHEQKAKILKYLGLFLISYIVLRYFMPGSILGLLACGLSLFCYAAPFEQLKPAIQAKSSQYFNLPIMIISLLNSIIWASYGYLTDNIFILLPNFIGLILVLIQLNVYFWTTNTISDDFPTIRILKKYFVQKEGVPKEKQAAAK